MDIRRLVSGVLGMALLVFCAVGCGCGDDDDDNDSASPTDDDADDDTGDDDTDDDNGDDDTWPPLPDDDADDDTEEPWDNLSDELGAGEIRAGFIAQDDELIGGPRARGEIGDIKLYNSEIEVIIRSPEHPGVGWTKATGLIADADIARPAGEPGQDAVWSLEQLVGFLRAFSASEVEILENGRNGRVVVRAKGKDIGIDIVDLVAPTWNHDLEIQNDYILEPDTDVLRIVTTVTSLNDNERTVFIADAPMWGDYCPVFAPRAGFETGEFDPLAAVRWVGGICDPSMNVSYALMTTNAERKFFAPYLDDEVLPLIQGGQGFGPTVHTHTYERRFVVGKGGSEAFEAELAAQDGEETFGTLQGALDSAKADDEFADVQIVVQDDGPDGTNFRSIIKPDSTGAYSIMLPEGDYSLTLQGDGRVTGAPVDVEVNAGETTTQDLDANPPGKLEFTVIDGEDDPVPCKLTFQPGYDAPVGAGVAHRVFSISGTGTANVLPGDYTVTISRGYEYEIDVHNVTIEAGETAVLNGTIERVVDSTGWMSGDFHIHTEYSIDSQAPAAVRVHEFAAECLEMPVVTDHDYRPDYAPIVAALDAGAFTQPIRGSEVSPVFGHFNTWPLDARPDKPDYYGVPMVEYADGVIVQRYQFPDMWDIVRSEFGADIVQINHPRDGSGWFTWVEYDPLIGVSSAHPNRWRDDFQAIEVFNSGQTDHGTLDDWFSFLDQGYAYTMTGNSDTHSVGDTPGNPRNVFAMPDDDPATADPEDMVDSIQSQKNFVSNGPFVTFELDGVGLGELVTDEDGTVDLQIKVQAPSWVRVNYLRVYSNHQSIVHEEAIGETTDVVRFDDAVSLACAEDAYFVVEVGHDSATLRPVVSDTVFAITNPIYVDADGNDEFDPPGLL